MKRRASVLAALATLATFAACKPAAPPRAPVTTREGTTVRTSCPEQMPQLAESEADKPFGARIDRVCWYGVSDEERPKLDALLAFHVSDTLQSAAVTSSLGAIMKSALVDDVVVGAEKRGDGAVVYVSVHELPRASEVVFDGEHMPPPFSEGDPISAWRIAQAIDHVKEGYVVQGYGDVKVDISTEPTTPGHARLRIHVTPGPQWHIAKLVFAGVTHLSAADLRAAAALQAGDPYDTDKVDAASLHMTDVFFDHGLLHAKMTRKTDVAEDGGVTVTWTITEGDAYTVRAIKLGKLAVSSAKDLAAVMKLKPKAVFDRSLAVADQRRIEDFYATRGKKVAITPGMAIDEAKKTVDVTYDVVEAN